MATDNLTAASDVWTMRCPVVGCPWTAIYPGEAQPGADLVLARHLAVDHVVEVAT